VFNNKDNGVLKLSYFFGGRNEGSCLNVGGIGGGGLEYIHED
jgi:hypothetical protein